MIGLIFGVVKVSMSLAIQDSSAFLLWVLFSLFLLVGAIMLMINVIKIVSSLFKLIISRKNVYEIKHVLLTHDLTNKEFIDSLEPFDKFYKEFGTIRR